MKSRLGTDAKGSPAFPAGQGTASDAQALRTLAEEISRAAAPRLEETALVLYDRDPRYLQAQWYVTPQVLAEACRLFPGDGSGLRQVLRLCRLDRDGRAEVVASAPQGAGASEGAGEGGFALPGDGAEYSCELGLESDAGGWLLLARSNRIESGERPLPPSRTAPVTDNPQVRNVSLATPEQPKESEDMPVEAALAAVGEPLHPVFPNPELDDAPLPGECPVPLAEAPDRARSQGRALEFPAGILRDSTLASETDDTPSVGRPTPLEETPDRAGSKDREPEYPPGVPPYLMSYRESGDVPAGDSTPPAEAPEQGTPRQEIPDQAGSGDRRSGFSPGISHALAPHRKAGAEIPAEGPVEAALAAVGEPLYPVFPNLDLDDVPSPEYSASSGEIPGRTWLPDRGLEFPSGIPRDVVAYPEMATDLPPGAELVDMPPPLLPSSPELNTATANMPGPIYDPRAALSSAVLSSGALPPLPDLELHAELIVHGHAVAGSTVDLFGHPIVVGADGRFYIRRPIAVSALEPLAAGGGLLAWLEAAGHG